MAYQESNLGPLDYRSRALPSELYAKKTKDVAHGAGFEPAFPRMRTGCPGPLEEPCILGWRCGIEPRSPDSRAGALPLSYAPKKERGCVRPRYCDTGIPGPRERAGLGWMGRPIRVLAEMTGVEPAQTRSTIWGPATGRHLRILEPITGIEPGTSRLRPKSVERSTV